MCHLAAAEQPRPRCAGVMGTHRGPSTHLQGAPSGPLSPQLLHLPPQAVPLHPQLLLHEAALAHQRFQHLQHPHDPELQPGQGGRCLWAGAELQQVLAHHGGDVIDIPGGQLEGALLQSLLRAAIPFLLLLLLQLLLLPALLHARRGPPLTSFPGEGRAGRCCRRGPRAERPLPAPGRFHGVGRGAAALPAQPLWRRPPPPQPAPPLRGRRGQSGEGPRVAPAEPSLSRGRGSGTEPGRAETMNDWAPIAKEYDPLKAGSIDGTDEEPHDRAIWRAMLARYVPNKGVTGDPHLTLFVARLNLQTTEEKLKEVFSRYGDIRKIRLVRDLVTGFSKGYAFIEYKEERALLKAHRDANRLVIDQHEIFVDFELERTLKGWIPRRLGGGFGGKKESGQLRFGGRDRPFRKPINLPNMKNDFYGEGSGEKRNWSREGTRDWRTRDRDHERSRDKRWPERERSWTWGESERERDSKEERSRGRERKDRDRKDRERDRSRERDTKKQRDDDKHR